MNKVNLGRQNYILGSVGRVNRAIEWKEGAVSYALAWYTWKDEKGWFSRILKFLLTGLIPIVSLMLFIWKLYNDPEQDQ